MHDKYSFEIMKQIFSMETAWVLHYKKKKRGGGRGLVSMSLQFHKGSDLCLIGPLGSHYLYKL